MLRVAYCPAFDAVFVDFFLAGAFAVLDGVTDPSEDAVPVVDDWLLVVPWFIVDELFTSVEVWLAFELLFTDRSPLRPRLTPGLMFAAAFTSVLLMPTLASTETFGFTESMLPDVDELPLGAVLEVDDDWLLVTP